VVGSGEIVSKLFFSLSISAWVCLGFRGSNNFLLVFVKFVVFPFVFVYLAICYCYLLME
jgi:hypothetical protein